AELPADEERREHALTAEGDAFGGLVEAKHPLARPLLAQPAHVEGLGPRILERRHHRLDARGGDELGIDLDPTLYLEAGGGLTGPRHLNSHLATDDVLKLDDEARRVDTIDLHAWRQIVDHLGGQPKLRVLGGAQVQGDRE